VPFKSHDFFPRVRVPAGFLLAALYFYYSQPSWKSLAVGGSIAFLGLIIRAWATGHLRKNDRLAVSGPYALTRNPLYFGSFLIGIGFSLAGAIAVFCRLSRLLCSAYGPVMQGEIETLKHLLLSSTPATGKMSRSFSPTSCQRNWTSLARTLHRES
jgi:protein-S-isoprenylcysteine O-methyltransferase Ste14